MDNLEKAGVMVGSAAVAGVGAWYWYNFVWYHYVPITASGQERLQALITYPRVRLPGLTQAQVTKLQALIQQWKPAITAVLANGVLVVNPASPVTIQMLAALPLPPSSPTVPSPFPGVSVPGASPAEVAYLGLLAHEGQLCGITSTGQPILCAG
jgi:hypothetical protein